MSKDDDIEVASESIESVAIDYVLGQVSEEQQANLNSRLKSDRDFADAVEEYKRTVKKVQVLADDVPKAPDISSLIDGQLSKTEKVRLWFNGGLGALAASVVLFLLVEPLLEEGVLKSNSASPPISAPGSGGYTTKANYNDARMAESADVLFTYLNGSFGALFMLSTAVAGIVILSISFSEEKKRFRKIGWLFILLSLISFLGRFYVSSFFNDQAYFG